MVRAAIGAGLGLLLTGLLTLLLAGRIGSPAGVLFAPLGASAFLIFAVPNSPLAQPWSAVVGNGLSALAALAIAPLGLDPAAAVALSVAAAVLLMMAARAMHPPGGAVALLLALNPDPAHGLGLALYPVAAATACLVLVGALYNRATGRKYPFRQPAEAGTHQTRDRAPDRRLGLSAEDLGRILADLRLAANIGPEDLARLIGAAEAEATARHVGGLTAADVMSRDVISIRPDTGLADLTRLFLGHGFKTLPVTDESGRYLGLLSQQGLLAPHGGEATAREMMRTDLRAAGPAMPLAPLLALLADGGQQAVPVVEGDRLAGIVSRTDMIGALAFALSR
ncbi:HPP family protein [Frigidibacter sp. SD6-1]|uniref:HPP family protein n=1 Tax=Frigidibacter sp. SD6-1 TaxID=3032581 RepID=UPI0024DFB30B|nr:HPP family protein [Frigidibacter sp. SD6-1]